MHRHFLIATVLLSLVVFAGIRAGAQTNILTVGGSTLPHAPILEFIKPLLLEEGIELRIVEFSDYVLPNLALNDGDLDANFFQHIPYLEAFSADHGLDLTWTEKVFIAPIGIYSRRLSSLDDLRNGAQIAFPNDATNGGRALLLLADAGLIELRENAGILATVFDIVKNPKNLRFLELEAPLLPRVLDDVDAAIINTTYALEADFVPVQDALFIEGADSPYVNVVAVRTPDADKPALKTLAEVLTRPAVREYILEQFQGSLVPVF